HYHPDTTHTDTTRLAAVRHIAQPITPATTPLPSPINQTACNTTREKELG
ncbi:TPA: hypothetical protein HA344_08675, partial [Candidatus Bathyarchaeota archaeon]|nr:hypothetical protein [Candidatus Bathyarchaeota archaeon]